MNEVNVNKSNNKKKNTPDSPGENTSKNPGSQNKHNKYNKYNKKRNKKQGDKPADKTANTDRTDKTDKNKLNNETKIKQKIIEKIEKINERINEKAAGDISPEPEYDYQPEEITAPAPVVETGPTVEIVGIRFKPVGKIYFFAPDGVQYSSNEKIIVETSRGLELGYIVIPNKQVSESKVVQPLKQVLRKASEEDIKKSERNKIAAKETIKIANDRIKFHNLNNMKMKLIEAEYTFDNSKLIYYFTADGRVDFRDLVKDLAAIFKTRIEMRQIGIRDQTKILGGLSICGRPFCCNSFLQDFAQVTIKMAKEQNISINSSKISGACGRLMCCLKYEHEAYDHLSKDTPKINSIVETSSGETGIITESNLLTGICKVRINPKNGPDSENIIKPFPKKNLKIIGFMKNEQEHLYDKNDKN